MTAFDVVAILIVLLSALIGFARGAVREVVTLVAFGAAGVLAVLALPFTAPAMRHVVHPGWAAAGAALLAVFVLVYVLLRVSGGSLARRLHASRLGGADRTLGGAFGVLRALVALGLFFLVYQAAMPAEISPRWITGALTWPVARASAHGLERLAPGGGRLRDGMGKLMSEDVKASFASGPARSDDAEPEGVTLGGGRGAAPSLDEAAPPDETAPAETVAERRRGLKVHVTEHARHAQTRRDAEEDAR